MSDEELKARVAALTTAVLALVSALESTRSIYALQALRDSSDPKMLEGWRKQDVKVVRAIAQAQQALPPT